MIYVSKECKEAFLSAQQKNLVLSFDDGTVIDNNDIAMESMNIEQYLCGTDELRFGEISSAKFKTKIKVSTKRYKDLWYNATLSVGEYVLKLGRFKVYSDNMTSDKLYREIVAYDALYDIMKMDVTEWFNSLNFPITQKAFRDSLFNYLGIEQVIEELPNDNVSFQKTTNAEKLTGLTVLQKLCEINATWGVINSDGRFKYVRMRTHEKDALYPSDNLFPSNNVFPNDIYDERLSKANYFQGSLKYEEYDTQPITKVTIREDADDLGYSYGENGNEYIIQNNFLLYGATDRVLDTVAKNFYSNAEYIAYTPSELKCKGAPWREVGDLLRVVADKKTLTMPILNRKLEGVCALKDAYIAKGKELYIVNTNGDSESIKQLQSRTNKLARTLDETKSEITKVEHETKDYADLAANSALNSANVSTDEKLLNYSTTTQMRSEIQQKADEINLSVEKNYVTNGKLLESLDNIQQQIDGAIETFTGSEVPTLNNYPANEWTTDAIRDTHIADLYVVNSEGGDYAGFYYRFEKVSTGYQWTLLKDSEVAKALQEAQEANAKADALANKLATEYSTTVQMRSEIKQTEDSIELSVTERVEEVKTYAENVANTAEQNAKDDTDERLQSYATKTEVSSQISESAHNIELSVESKITETKSYATSAANKAEQNANENTNERLKAYSTTTEMQAIINLTTEEITSSVSKSIGEIKNDGRNYLLDSGEEQTHTVYTSYKLSEQKERLNSQNVVISFDAKANEGIKRIYIDTSEGTIGETVGSITSEYKRFTVKIDALEDWTAINNVSLRPSPYVRIYTRNAKLEIGETATNWTYAPEDFPEKFEQYPTTEEMQSEIKQTADKISLEVSKKVGEEEVKTIIEQTAEEILLKGHRVVIDSEKFDLEADGTATFTSSGQIWIPPTTSDFDRISRVVLGQETVSGNLFKAMDFNCDGKINITDLTACKSILLGKRDISYYVDTFGYQKQYSTVSLKLQPDNIEKTILISGTNSFGTYVETYYGINVAKTELIKSEAANIGKIVSGEIATELGANLDNVSDRVSSLETFSTSGNWKYRKIGTDGLYELLYLGPISRGTMSPYGALYYTSFSIALPNDISIEALYEFNANIYHGTGLMGAQLRTWNANSFSFYVFSAKQEDVGEKLSFRAIVKTS